MPFECLILIPLWAPIILTLPFAIGDWLDKKKQNYWHSHPDTDWKVPKNRRKKNDIREYW